MNYDQFNTMQDYWVDKIYPNLQQHVVVESFNDYLKRTAFLPSFAWLRKFESVKVVRIASVVNSEKFTEKYTNNCVTFCAPSSAEGAFMTILYQITPELLVEASLSMWVERDEAHSYISLISCYSNDTDFEKFMKDVKLMRMKGDTTKPVAGVGGFGAGLGGSINLGE